MKAPSIDLGARPADWLDRVSAALAGPGYVVLENCLDGEAVRRTKEKLYEAKEKITAAVGAENLDRNERGILRVLPQFDPYFLSFLEMPDVLAVVDRTVSDTAVLYTQNGIVLPSSSSAEDLGRVQYRLHPDFPRYLNGALSAVDILFALDDFSEKNGGTRVVPGSQQKPGPADQKALEAAAVSVECPAGSAIVFDGTLWHSSGRNVSGHDRCALNHVFCRSYFKQQIDYVRVLGDAAVQKLKPRTQQLLGWYTRIPARIEEYYLAEEKRLFRRGQG